MNGRRALVLFDIDGTLMRGAGPHHKNALIEGIRTVTGVETHLNGVPTSGMLDGDLIAYMLQAGGYSQKRARGALREIMRACEVAYAADCIIDLTPSVCAGVRELLDGLRDARVAVGLVTGNLAEIGWKKLELAGLRQYFSVGAFAQDGRSRTRLARIAWQRARKAGLIEANARVSLIGDHMNDIEAAKANGFQAVAVASGLTLADELAAAKPDVLVNSLTQLPVAALL